MINLPRIVLVLFGLSALLDIAEKVSRFMMGHDKDKEEEKKQDEPSRGRLQILLTAYLLYASLALR